MRITKLFAAVAAAGLLALPVAAGAQEAPAPTVEASRQVTTDPNPLRLYVTPALAVDPSDPSTVVIAAGDARNGGCGLRVTTDGGLSWRTTVPNLLPDGEDFCIQRNFGPAMGIAFASDGTLYTAFSGSSVESGHPNGPISAYVARSSDLGVTHQTMPVYESQPFEYQPEDGPVDVGFDQARLTQLAVDPSDPQTLYVGWRQWISGTSAPFDAIPENNDTLVAASHDGGETWTEPFNLMGAFDEEIAASDSASLVVASDGTAYAFTKERPARPADGEPTPNARLFMSKSTDGGETWATTVAYEGVPVLDAPTAAIDPSTDALYLVFAQRGAERSDPSKPYFTTSTDGGATWSEPTNLVDDGLVSSYNQYFPGISVAPNGRVDVAWHDFRNDPFFQPGGEGPMGSSEGERYWDVYSVSSSDAGATWTEPIRVTDRSVDGDLGVTFSNSDIRGPIGIASTNASAYFAWSDTRAGSVDFDASDVYFTRARLSGGVAGTAATPSGDANLLWAVVGAGAAFALGGLVLLLSTRGARGNKHANVVAEERPRTTVKAEKN